VREPRERDDCAHELSPRNRFARIEFGREAREGATAIHQTEPAMTPERDTIELVTGDTGMRELDHRSSDDIEVTLLWSARTDRVFVLVLERRTEALFHFEAAPAQAMDAFHHPYAYAQQVHLEDAVAA
jgi:hypothetical protein